MSTKYDHIGQHYNVTRKADPRIAGRMIHHLQPVKGGTYLDIGCGTGNYTREFAQPGYSFLGIDPSEEMLNKARARNEAIDWRKGSSTDTGLNDQSVDGIVATLTIHHWEDLRAGFAELFRVLKPGGRFVLFTSTTEQMAGYWLHHYFPKMMADSSKQMPSWAVIEPALLEAGFVIRETETYDVHPGIEDKFLYSGKHDPEQYFDPVFRRGISSFSSLADPAEVEKGLQQLRADIGSGTISEVMASFASNVGDYVIVVAERA